MEVTSGDRIRFLKTLEEGPTGDHPALIYARKGDFGTIDKVGVCREGFLVFWDRWPKASFGCKREEFELIKEPESND